jgi:hypothetical protein
MCAPMSMAPNANLIVYRAVSFKKKNFSVMRKKERNSFVFSLGHVLCASCCSTIVEKTSPRLTPVCPFCREGFSNDDVRLIRTDFSSSGWSTPRRLPTVEANATDFSDLWARRTERLIPDNGSRTRQEARRLEDKVAKVAAKKCSVEEVSLLYKELEDWLRNEMKDDQVYAFVLSLFLLSLQYSFHPFHPDFSLPQCGVAAGYPYESSSTFRSQ